MLAVMKFIAPIGAGSRPREKEFDKGVEARNMRYGMKSEKLEENNEEENGKEE